MRIVHLSSSDTNGGAARAAFRLHKALVKAGEDSIMLVGSKSSSAESVWEMPQATDSLSHWAYLLQTLYIDRNRTELSDTWFSLGWPGLDVAAHPMIASADILHLHWVTGYLAPGSIALLEQLDKPIVWTLHDQRAFTGGCHYSAGCEGYTTHCERCLQLSADRCQLPATNLIDQQRLCRRERLTIVALSRWMADCVARSALLQHCRVEIIPNSLETEVFIPLDKRLARARLGWPPDAVCILFGADNGEEKRKGLAELLAALKLCLADEAFARGLQENRILLACFGIPSPALAECGMPFKSLGYLSSDSDLAGAYAAASFFVLPSLEDNLPNTVLEAMSCGTPVIAFNCGGVPDMVSDPLTGRLAPTGDVRALSRNILSLTVDPEPLDEMGRAARKIIEDYYTAPLQAQKMRALYKELMASPINTARSKTTPSADAAQGQGWSAPVTADMAGPGFQKLLPRLVQHVLASAPTDMDLVVDARARKAVEAAVGGKLSHADLLHTLGKYRPILARRKRRKIHHRFRRWWRKRWTYRSPRGS